MPRFGGLVLDMTSLTEITAVTDRAISAQAGARMINLEQAAWNRGSQLWMYPSTVQSTLGGFLAGGSAGTGTIVHGRNHEGFVESVDVVYGTDDAELIHLEGDDAQPMVHTWRSGWHHRLGHGTAGTIAGLEMPVRELHRAARRVHHRTGAVKGGTVAADPVGRRSADGGGLPDDPAIVKGRASVRGIFDARCVEQVTDIITTAGGRVEAIRDGIAQSIKMSTLSYNHPRGGYKKAYPASTFIWNAWVTRWWRSSTKCRRCTTAVWCTWKPGTGRCSGWPTASSTARSRSWTACPRSPNSVSPCILRTSGTSTSTPTASKHLPPRRIRKDC